MEERKGPSVCCSRMDCAFNDCYGCSAEHIRLSEQGGCLSYLSRAQAVIRELEVHCAPFDKEAPVVFIGRCDNGNVPADMLQLGFERKPEPQTGLFSPFKRPSSNHFVWVLRVDFERMDRIKEKAAEMGYQIKNFITKEEERAYFNMRKYSSMSSQEKDAALKRLVEPQKPAFLGDQHWNGKIYGYGGNAHIYLSGQKRELTTKEIQVLRDYLDALDSFQNERCNLTLFG